MYIRGMDHPSNKRLWAEVILLCAILPTVLYFLPPRGVVFLTLWTIALTMIWVMKRHKAWSKPDIFRKDRVTWKVMKPVLIRFALSAFVLSTGVVLFEPERLLSLPLERPHIWMMVMIGYPLISVFPQEVIYRTYFFWRYAPIFTNPKVMIWVSGIAFGYVHVIFNNWVALLLSCIGGVMFSQTYDRTRSLAVVWIEHALYGCFIFTIGLGWYFFSGAQMQG